MCLLPPRDTRAVINQLIKEGYVDHIPVPMNATKPGALSTGPS